MTKLYRCSGDIKVAIAKIMEPYIGAARAIEMVQDNERVLDAILDLEGVVVEAVNYTVVRDSVVRELEDFGFDYDDGIIDRIMEERSPEWEWS